MKSLISAALAAALSIPPLAAAGEAYPSKPIRIITAAAGGGSDFVARMIATPLGPQIGQQVIVDNRGLLASDIAAKAPPDGYTLLLSGGTLWLLPFMREGVASDQSDFVPLTMATQTVNILVVHPSLPAQSVKEVIGLAKAQPGQLNFATSGNGNSVHIAGELFKAMTHTQIVRVNYKAASQALTDLIAGQTQLMFSVPGSAVPHVKAKRLRALAVTSAKPSPLFPELPTVSGTVPGYETVSVIGMFAPAGTPPAIVNRLSQEIGKVLQRPDVRDKFIAQSIEPFPTTPDAASALIKSEMARMGKVIKSANIRAD
ncbi:MAG TPA: tripartite tricarboxylate transporter substrate-binding protein [Burkholderiales bacterium]|nr:tripartite tricarboxylate transporter substrate-binding protein [Burkholderiales bacterium]